MCIDDIGSDAVNKPRSNKDLTLYPNDGMFRDMYKIRNRKSKFITSRFWNFKEIVIVIKSRVVVEYDTLFANIKIRS